MDIKEVFAQRLIQLREDNNITQQTLADDLEITRQSLSLYEKADRTINIDLLYKIAKYFDVSADYLLGLTNNKTLDITVKAICEYTGLNDEAIESLADFVDPYYLEPDPNATSEEEIERSRKIALNEIDVRNDFIASGWFWDIVGFISAINIDSKEWENLTINKIHAQIEGNVEDERYFFKKALNLSKECDVRRYLITKKIDEFVNFYDSRIDEKHERNFMIHDREEELKEKLLKENPEKAKEYEKREKLIKELIFKEAPDNGKHNPPKE